MWVIAHKRGIAAAIAIALVSLVVGGGLWFSGTQPSSSVSQPITVYAADGEERSTLVEQGVLARVRRGEIIGKEAFALRRQGEGFVLITTAEFQGSRQGVDFVQRLATSLPLTADYRPQAYTLVQIVEWGDDTLELQHLVHRIA